VALEVTDQTSSSGGTSRRETPSSVQPSSTSGNMDEALDLTQETYARAWQHWDVVSRHANRDAWSRVVLYNLAVSRWRRLALERARAPSRSEAYEPLDTHDLDLARLVARLPTNQRQALSCTSCSTSPSTTLPTR